MYIITVKFNVVETYLNEFLQAMRRQAEDSLRLEKNCHYFDVCQSTAEPTTIFLYEIYETEMDFKDHLVSQHFMHFSTEVAPWVKSKTVESFVRPAAASGL
jgi:(4S)-4-hydroxy-5-phosphonooxypentane-2,3-dione isomerase